jgi:hypothetical protein
MAGEAIPFILRAFDVGDESENPARDWYAKTAFGNELCKGVAELFPFPELVPTLTKILKDYTTYFEQDAVVTALSSIGPEAGSAKSAIEGWLSYLLSAQPHRTDAIGNAKKALVAIEPTEGPEMPEARRKQIEQNRKEGVFPCILCGKDIRAAGGSNTVSFKGRTFACCNAGCGRPQGAYDTSYVNARIEGLSERERCRSELSCTLT